MNPSAQCRLVLFAALFATAAMAQNAPRRIVGDVVRYEGDVLTVRSGAGAEERVKVVPTARILTRSKANVDAVQLSQFVGVTAAPRGDGTLVASEIQIFPEAMRGIGEGHRPMTGANTMTNATVTSAARAQARSTTEGTVGNVVQQSAERRLNLTYKDGQKSVLVPDSAVVFATGVGDASLLKAGAHVVVYAAPQADGSLSSDRVSVGVGGYVPPR